MHRTTVEISEEHHRALTALARRRGVRGFSVLVQEALTEYLSNAEIDELEALLELEGSIDEAQADGLLWGMQETRSGWRTS
jgi:predicted transcriptional regulator